MITNTDFDQFMITVSDAAADPNIVCDKCQHRICTVQATDTLGVLQRTASAHQCAQEISIEIQIDNTYPDEAFSATKTVTCKTPTQSDDDYLDEWAQDNLFPHTGTGRCEGEAFYEVAIMRCDYRPDLEGRTWDWGL